MRGCAAMISAPIWNLGVAVDWVGGRAGLDGRQVVVEVGSVLDRKFSKLRRNLSDPDAKVVVVEHRDRLACFGWSICRLCRLRIAESWWPIPGRGPMIWCAT